jgi:ribonuclease HI
MDSEISMTKTKKMHDRPPLLIATDGSARFGGHAGWGVVLRSDDNEWLSLGYLESYQAEFVEFQAALEGLRCAALLGLLWNTNVRILSDSRRMIRACSGRPIPIVYKTDWKRLDRRLHVLHTSCLEAREEIRKLIAGNSVEWKWVRRQSHPDNIRADALAKLAAGHSGSKALQRSGLTREQWHQYLERNGLQHFRKPNQPLDNRVEAERYMFLNGCSTSVYTRQSLLSR